MLILFDIDATLLKTSRAGLLAMGDAGRELFGEGFIEEGVDFAGRLDPLILVDLIRQNGREPDAALLADYRTRYGVALRRRLAVPGIAATLPGVPELIAALAPTAARGEIVLGLLTGNFPETGELKIRAAGLDFELFTVHAWGDDSPHTPPARDHLPPVAMNRHAARHGRPIDPNEVVIIGDTPHDIACARAHGCRSLGVGTGLFTAAHLLSLGADHAVDDLGSTQEIVTWLLTPRRSPRTVSL